MVWNLRKVFFLNWFSGRKWFVGFLSLVNLGVFLYISSSRCWIFPFFHCNENRQTFTSSIYFRALVLTCLELMMNESLTLQGLGALPIWSTTLVKYVLLSLVIHVFPFSLLTCYCSLSLRNDLDNLIPIMFMEMNAHMLIFTLGCLIRETLFLEREFFFLLRNEINK